MDSKTGLRLTKSTSAGLDRLAAFENRFKNKQKYTDLDSVPSLERPTSRGPLEKGKILSIESSLDELHTTLAETSKQQNVEEQESELEEESSSISLGKMGNKFLRKPHIFPARRQAIPRRRESISIIDDLDENSITSDQTRLRASSVLTTSFLEDSLEQQLSSQEYSNDGNTVEDVSQDEDSASSYRPNVLGMEALIGENSGGDNSVAATATESTTAKGSSSIEEALETAHKQSSFDDEYSVDVTTTMPPSDEETDEEDICTSVTQGIENSSEIEKSETIMESPQEEIMPETLPAPPEVAAGEAAAPPITVQQTTAFSLPTAEHLSMGPCMHLPSHVQSNLNTEGMAAYTQAASLVNNVMREQLNITTNFIENCRRMREMQLSSLNQNYQYTKAIDDIEQELRSRQRITEDSFSKKVFKNFPKGKLPNLADEQNDAVGNLSEDIHVKHQTRNPRKPSKHITENTRTSEHKTESKKEICTKSTNTHPTNNDSTLRTLTKSTNTENDDFCGSTSRQSKHGTRNEESVDSLLLQYLSLMHKPIHI